MIRQFGICVLLVAVMGLSLDVYAQGRRPSNAGSQGAAPSGPNIGRPGSFGPSSVDALRAEAAARRAEAEARRAAAEQAETRRAEAEQRRVDAQLRRDLAADNNESADARSAHPPNEHAAPEAALAEQNAQHQDLREVRPDLREDNRGDRGPR